MPRIVGAPRWALVLAVSAAACNRAASPIVGIDAGAGGGGGAAGATEDRDATLDTSSDGRTRDGQLPDLPDPGRVLIHRLDKVEYDNTVKDLLGVMTTPASTFEDDDLDGTRSGFDNTAENLDISTARYQQYFDAAKSLADAVWQAGAVAVGWGESREHEAAKALARAGQGGAVQALEEVAAAALRDARLDVDDRLPRALQ